jgi:DNA-binding SARP family transcriptional activator
MKYRVLGPVEVLDDDGAPVDVGSRQQRALLALLLTNVGRVVSTERILEELWADDPEGKEKTLWVYVSRLRSALEPARAAHSKGTVLVTRDHGYALTIDPDDIDAHCFGALVEKGRALVRDNPTVAAELLTNALAMWRGEPYEDFTYDDFAQDEITNLREMQLSATEDRIDAEIRTGRQREVIGELDGLMRANPLRERPVELLMISLYRSGRQADALRTYQSHRRTVGEELGIEPSPELRRIEEQVLLHDPRLSPSRELASLELAQQTHNPFKGLQAFTEGDVAAFFGRDRLISEIVRRLAAGNRLVALVGCQWLG